MKMWLQDDIIDPVVSAPGQGLGFLFVTLI